jgi:calnexin
MLVFVIVVCFFLNFPARNNAGCFFFQSFDGDHVKRKWIASRLPNYTGKWEIALPAPPKALPEEKMLFMTTPNSSYGISTKFDTPFDPTNKILIIQYEVRVQEHLECGGFYIKLFGGENFNPISLSNETAYVIMFGPDKCGSANKVHFIFRHLNPRTGVFEEKRLVDPPVPRRDSLTHLYTLIVRPDNRYEILIDGESSKEGSLLTDFSPPVNPPVTIDDPHDTKPVDWVDNELIPDPNATKPPDWDESEPEFINDPRRLAPPEGWLLLESKFIPDPIARKPHNWDNDLYGDWEPRLIPNPKCELAPGCGSYTPPIVRNPLYKGRWNAPKIPNPEYKGIWKPRKIRNPDYVEDLHPHNFKRLIGVGFELWTVNKGVGFNNVFIGSDESAMRKWIREHFVPKQKAQIAALQKLKPKKTKKNAHGGVFRDVTVFVRTSASAWWYLYNDNPIETVLLSVFMAGLPVLLLGRFCHCSKRQKFEAKRKAVVLRTVELSADEEDEEAAPEPPLKIAGPAVNVVGSAPKEFAQTRVAVVGASPQDIGLSSIEVIESPPKDITEPTVEIVESSPEDIAQSNVEEIGRAHV